MQELIKDQVANMYLWPKTLQVQILDPAEYASRCSHILSYVVIFYCDFFGLGL